MLWRATFWSSGPWEGDDVADLDPGSTSLVVSQRRAGEVVYSISVPGVRDLPLSARKILVGLAETRSAFEDELMVTPE